MWQVFFQKLNNFITYREGVDYKWVQNIIAPNLWYQTTPKKIGCCQQVIEHVITHQNYDSTYVYLWLLLFIVTSPWLILVTMIMCSKWDLNPHFFSDSFYCSTLTSCDDQKNYKNI